MAIVPERAVATPISDLEILQRSGGGQVKGGRRSRRSPLQGRGSTLKDSLRRSAQADKRATRVGCAGAAGRFSRGVRLGELGSQVARSRHRFVGAPGLSLDAQVFKGVGGKRVAQGTQCAEATRSHHEADELAEHGRGDRSGYSSTPSNSWPTKPPR